MTNAYQTRLSEMQQGQLNLAASGDLAEILVKAESVGADALTETELFRVRAWETSVQWRMESQFYQYKQGFLDKIALERTLDDIASLGIYEEWEDLGLVERLYPPEWKAMIESRVKGLGGD